jgi:hypothetical protein
MSARKRNAWRWQTGLGLTLLGSLLRCAPAYDVLASGDGPEGDITSPGVAGTSASAGISGALGAAGFCSGSSCAGAGYGGTESGGAESGGTGSGGYVTAGVGPSSPGGTGALAGSGGGGAIGTSCVSHQSCAGNAICRGGFCEACPEPTASCAGPCRQGFEAVAVSRNGCRICECAPISECVSDADCQNDELCYPGAQCEDGCAEPACCRGNQCSAPGCGPGAAPHCLAAGCASGGTCLAACDSVTCECSGGSWSCAGSVSTAGAPGNCAQACVPP